MLTKDEIQKEALDKILKHKRCTAAISMGVGKTLLGLKYIEHLQKSNMFKLKVLVVAPKLSIFTSWTDDAEKFKISSDNISFTTYLSLPKQNPKYYDILVLDECHSILPSSEAFLEEYSGRILGLTGTPPRYNNSEKGILVNKYCPVVFSYLTDDAIDNEILNDYRIVIHKMPLSQVSDIPVVLKTQKTFFTSEANHYEYWTKRFRESVGMKQKQITSLMRMRALMDFKTKENYALNLLKQIDDKCLLFCNTQEQADRMSKHSYHSKNPNSEVNLDKFKKGEIDLLSCVQQLNEGVNIPNLRASIILHSFGNERKFAQKLGRTLRLSPGELAVVHILCYEDTVDEKWITEAIKDFDPKKIKVYSAKNKE
jgi:superfamily II DNA or RNA helicase